mmetsp:Transcript_9771/g.24558  ORF Transcript_9771/g.24558 Transcript_9771/m.24558 type:complete len:200 (-) Transcript_9771:63-662(-)
MVSSQQHLRVLELFRVVLHLPPQVAYCLPHLPHFLLRLPHESVDLLVALGLLLHPPRAPRRGRLLRGVRLRAEVIRQQQPQHHRAHRRQPRQRPRNPGTHARPRRARARVPVRHLYGGARGEDEHVWGELGGGIWGGVAVGNVGVGAADAGEGGADVGVGNAFLAEEVDGVEGGGAAHARVLEELHRRVDVGGRRGVHT